MILLLLACTGPSGDSGSQDTTAGTPTFAEIQSEVFTPGCAFSTCHGAGSPAQGLDLSEGVAYAAIVDVDATQVTGLKLVAPGDSANSYVYQKSAGAAGIIGDAMPPTAGLEATRLELLAAWIDAGAAND